MKKRVVAFAALFALAGCADSNVVDGKVVVEVPNPSGSPTVVTCHLLEVEHIDGTSGEDEGADSFMCVDKAQWDRNHVGEELVDEKGQIVK